MYIYISLHIYIYMYMHMYYLLKYIFTRFCDRWSLFIEEADTSDAVAVSVTALLTRFNM